MGSNGEVVNNLQDLRCELDKVREQQRILNQREQELDRQIASLATSSGPDSKDSAPHRQSAAEIDKEPQVDADITTSGRSPSPGNSPNYSQDDEDDGAASPRAKRDLSVSVSDSPGAPLSEDGNNDQASRGESPADVASRGRSRSLPKKDSQAHSNLLDDFFNERPKVSEEVATHDTRVASPPDSSGRSRPQGEESKRDKHTGDVRRSRSVDRPWRRQAGDGAGHSQRDGGLRPQDRRADNKNHRQNSRDGSAATSKEEKIEKFVARYKLDGKVRNIMVTMQASDLDLILQEHPSSADNPTGFVIAKIRKIEAAAGRPMGVASHKAGSREQGGRERGSVQPTGARSNRSRDGPPGHADRRDVGGCERGGPRRLEVRNRQAPQARQERLRSRSVKRKARFVGVERQPHREARSRPRP